MGRADGLGHLEMEQVEQDSRDSFDMNSPIDSCHGDVSKENIEVWVVGILADIENTVPWGSSREVDLCLFDWTAHLVARSRLLLPSQDVACQQ